MRMEVKKAYSLNQDGLGLIHSLYLLGDLFRPVLACNVIYGQVTIFSGKLLRYQCA